MKKLLKIKNEFSVTISFLPEIFLQDITDILGRINGNRKHREHEKILGDTGKIELSAGTSEVISSTVVARKTLD